MLFRNKTQGKRGEPLPLNNDGLPDSNNPAGLCPRCLKQSSYEILHSLPLTFDGGYIANRDGPNFPTFVERVSVLICRNCNQGIVVLEEQFVGEYKAIERKGGGQISWRGFHWWPLPGSLSHEGIPEEISSAFNEAVLAVAANCPRAGVVMARRTLEAITSDKGEVEGTLFSRLEKLTNKGLLHKTLAEWAKEVRLLGNVGAHFDPIKDVSIDDAKQLLNFLNELLKYLYILPFELEKRRGNSIE